ncbi:response regulator receiver domain [Massilia sp. SM-13]|uniref:response regulator receiver domain n=1 Tax=Pseudoduganella rhizocola TaxID=3382643 RepID=UPI0038B676B9
MNNVGHDVNFVNSVDGGRLINMSKPAASSNNYRHLVREAFLDSIRTAVVVDDEFPTLDDFLSDPPLNVAKESASMRLWEKKNGHVGKVREIIQLCRMQQPYPWIVDVHDGKRPTLSQESSAASHMDHSDLLILDYHLDESGNGDRAISILKNLAANSHFNLAIVYTRNRDNRELSQTVDEIAVGLTFPEHKALDGKHRASLTNKIDEFLSNSGNDFEQVLEVFDTLAFLKVASVAKPTWDAVKDFPELEEFKSIVDTIPPGSALRPQEFFLYFCDSRRKQLESALASQNYGKVHMHRGSDGVNWIRTDSLFVTVVSKEHAASSLVEKLLDALEAWNPPPHRLLLSKMRNELARHGVIAEGRVLSNEHLQSGWLRELTEPDKLKLRTNVRAGVARQWDSLGGKIEQPLVEFAEKLVANLGGVGEEVFKRFGLEKVAREQHEVYLQLNSYACSKSVEGHHLFTGHVLRIGKGGDTQHWLCLTPACDLEPGQKGDRGWARRLGDWLPFKAVRLYKADSAHALSEATRGFHLFLRLDGAIQAFGFADSNQNVFDNAPALAWEQFFASNQGNFDGEKNTLRIASIGDGTGPLPKEKDAEVVAQLRYEYAINLIQRLGAHLARVGLDFHGYAPPKESVPPATESV